MTSPKNTLAKRRNAVYLSQAALGAKVGATEKTVRNWEAGKSSVQTNKRAALGAALGITNGELDELLAEIAADAKAYRDAEAAAKVKKAVARAPRTTRRRSPGGQQP